MILKFFFSIVLQSLIIKIIFIKSSFISFLKKNQNCNIIFFNLFASKKIHSHV